MIHTGEGFCELRGGRQQWQVLWSDYESHVSLIGMTPKMKEQLEWCGEYLTEFPPRTPFQRPLFKLDMVKRVGLDNLLLYTMIRRRLQNDPNPDYTYYTLAIPKYLPQDSVGEVVMHLSAMKEEEEGRKPHKIRMSVYLDVLSAFRPQAKVLAL